jgi:hypothetical protein
MPLKPGARNNLMAAHSTPRPDRQLGFDAYGQLYSQTIKYQH